MGRGKKRHSRIDSKEKSVAQEETTSDGDHEPQLDPSVSKNEGHDHLSADPEVEDFGEEVSTNSLTEQSGDEYVDVLGNGHLLKKVLFKGIGAETRPGHGDVVEISYKGWLDNGVLVEDVSSKFLTLGDGDVVQALELALPLAEHQERFELISDARFTYGSRGREPDIPGDSKLRYEVQLISVRDPPDYSAMSNAERVSIADEKRERGNYYYRREEYAFAVNSYNKALKILTVPVDESQSAMSSEDVVSLEVKLQNNLAATQLKIQAYNAAIKSCDAVLSKDPSNFKALFRKGKALLEQGDADEAIPILNKLHDLVPTSVMVASELQRARAIQGRQQERWTRAAARMFPQVNRSKPHQSKLGRIRNCLCSLRLLFIVSILVAIAAVVFTFYRDQLPPIEQLKQAVLSVWQ